MKTCSIKGQQVIGIPIRSKTIDHIITEDQSSALKRSRIHLILNRINKFRKKADSFAHGIKEHVRLGPTITETVILQFGRIENIFKKLFQVGEDEKLLKASQCCISTSVGPIAGLLFISTQNIAFCSRKLIKLSSPTGEPIRDRYKVVIPVNKIKRVNQCENVNKPSKKYVEIVTVDDLELWFIEFLNHKKVLKCIQLLISESVKT